MSVDFVPLYTSLPRSNPFASYRRRGLVRRVLHPTLPLALYEYTAKAVYDAVWDPELRIARGLVVEHPPSQPDRIGRIVANPFPRFANLHEIPETKPENLPSDLYLSDKLDGSLVLLWHYRDGWHFSTRGSFVSPQAEAAEAWFRVHARFPEDISLTYLFEWISPDNRILVDYGGRRELILLAARETGTGREVHPARLPLLAFRMGVRPVGMRQLASPSELPRDFAAAHEQEGYVLYSHDPYLRVKVKSPEYQQVHRILSHLSPSSIAEALSTGQRQALLDTLPAPFHPRVLPLIEAIESAHRSLVQEAARVHAHIVHLPSRKDQAMAIHSYPKAVQAIIFALLDGRPEKAASIAWRCVQDNPPAAGLDVGVPDF